VIGKNILSLDAHRWLRCCWDDCDRRSFDLYMTVFHDHAKGVGCDHPDAKHPRYTFCTERHRQFFLHSHIAMGKLPPGWRLAVG